MFSSQTELAAAAGMKPQRISDIINGRYENPRLDTLFRLAVHLRCPIDTLVRDMRPDYDTIETSAAPPGEIPRRLLDALESLSEGDRAQFLALLERFAEMSTPPCSFRHGLYVGRERRQAS